MTWWKLTRKVLPKYRVHNILKMAWCLGETKGHSFILENTVLSYYTSEFFTAFTHRYIMKAGLYVKGTEVTATL